MYEPGSPGRVFVLNENDLIDLVIQIEDLSQGNYRWSESTGLKQLSRRTTLNCEDTLSMIRESFNS